MITKIPSGNRIAKFLSRSGIASRREAEKLILQGKVKVNGKLIHSPALNILETDIITVDGKTVNTPERTRVWRYHKPVNLITSTKDEKNRKFSIFFSFLLFTCVDVWGNPSLKISISSVSPAVFIMSICILPA